MLPRSVNFVTVAGLMSTHATLTHAGSRLPVAIECSIVATIRQKPTPRIISRICDWASSASVTTSGSGPSSRMLPARRYGTLCLTHSYMMPLLRIPWATAFLMPPSRRILLIARRWCSCPSSGGRFLGIDEDAAVHLLVLDFDPVAAEPDLCAIVGRAVEVFGKSAVHVGRHSDAIVRADRHGPVVVDGIEDFLEDRSARGPHF